MPMNGVRDSVTNMWGFKTLFLLMTLAVTTPFLWAQQGGKPQPKTPASTQNVLPTKGLIDHGTYKNPSIGLEFTPAQSLRLKEPVMNGTPGKTPLFITVQAENDPGSVFSQTIFYAEALAFYPEEQRTTAKYFQRSTQVVVANGFSPVPGRSSAQISGIPFLCEDFAKGAVHETLLVMTHGAYAYVFIFVGPDGGVTNKLVESTKVKLTR
jgi:hypothetical protein